MEIEQTRVAGTPVSQVTIDELLSTVGERPSDAAVAICFCNVHMIMACRRDAALRHAVVSMDVVAPDGRPVAWALGILSGHIFHARGADFMRAAIRRGAFNDWKHYFFGSTNETLERLTKAAASYGQNVQIVGVESPPFRSQTPAEQELSVQRILESGADFVWVGLGMPKQELWIAEVRDRLPGKVLLGVGAAFDFLAGQAREAPMWIQRSGLEWAYRLAHEPRRMWRRYLWNNPAFLALLGMQVLSERVFGRRSRTPVS